MKVMILSVAIGGWYPRGLARMIEEFHRVSPGFEIAGFCNVLPPGTPTQNLYPNDGYDYTGYIAKPFAMKYALDQGADIAILLDAAFYPIRAIHPLIDHIAQKGYYLCRNGNQVGEWSSDEALRIMGIPRASAMLIQEASSYCVGLNFAHENIGPRLLAARWAERWRAIPGPHTSSGCAGRNAGFVSREPFVRGHRHDQTTLSILAYGLGMTELTERPKFTAYLGSETEETVLCNRGMGS